MKTNMIEENFCAKTFVAELRRATKINVPFEPNYATYRNKIIRKCRKEKDVLLICKLMKELLTVAKS